MKKLFFFICFLLILVGPGINFTKYLSQVKHFSFIQKQVTTIVKFLEKNQYPNPSIHSKRFTFFDKVFINVLAKRKMKGKHIFIRIFSSNKLPTIFRFLSNTSSWKENIAIMSSLPKRLFLKSAMEVLFKRQ